MLVGAFVVEPTEPLPPNAIFDFTIQTLRFRSGAFFGTEYIIEGNAGRISGTTLDPGHASVRMTTTINGQAVELQGVGSADTFTTGPHPELPGILLSGAGYEVTIFAVPEL